MGFYFRKSINLGPFRINLSKEGIGYSVGAAGFRSGTSATGRKYSTFSLPGTGVGYKTGGNANKGWMAIGMPIGALIFWLVRHYFKF